MPCCSRWLYCSMESQKEGKKTLWQLRTIADRDPTTIRNTREALLCVYEEHEVELKKKKNANINILLRKFHKIFFFCYHVGPFKSRLSIASSEKREFALHNGRKYFSFLSLPIVAMTKYTRANKARLNLLPVVVILLIHTQNMYQFIPHQKIFESNVSSSSLLKCLSLPLLLYICAQSHCNKRREAL